MITVSNKVSDDAACYFDNNHQQNRTHGYDADDVVANDRIAVDVKE